MQRDRISLSHLFSTVGQTLKKPLNLLKPLSVSALCWSPVWVFLFISVLRTLWGTPFYRRSIHSPLFLFTLTLLCLFHFLNICLHICHELILSASKFQRRLEQKDALLPNLVRLLGSWDQAFCIIACPSLAILRHCCQQATWQERDTTSWAVFAISRIPTMGRGAIYSFIHLVTHSFIH